MAELGICIICGDVVVNRLLPKTSNACSPQCKDYRNRTRSTWASMNKRCHDPQNAKYYMYGARGIFVCDRWKGPNGFLNFLTDMGPRPKGRTIDRRNNNDGYHKDNCRWATPLEQAQNGRHRRRFLSHNGRTLTIAQWARKTGLSAGLIYQRVARQGRTGDDIFAATPKMKRQFAMRGASTSS